MTKNPILYPILLKILRIVLMTAGTSLTSILLTKKLIDQGQQASILSLLADSAPAILAAVPGIWWDMWTWLQKFDWFVKFETSMHLPITGRPSALALATAQVAKINADAAGDPVAAVSPSGTGVVSVPVAQ